VVVVTVAVAVVVVLVAVVDVSVDVVVDTVVDVKVVVVDVQPPMYTAASPSQLKQSRSELVVDATASYSPSTQAVIGWHSRLNNPSTGARV